MREYILEHKSTNPNSIDIHKVYKIKNIQSYLTKELVKSQQQINPNKDNYTDEYANKSYKFWDCSTTLKGNQYFKLEFDEDTAYHLYNSINNNDHFINTIKTDFANIYTFKMNSIKLNIPINKLEQYATYLDTIKNKTKKEKDSQQNLFNHLTKN